MFWSWWARPAVCSGRWGWERPGWRQEWDHSCPCRRHPGERSPHWWDCSRSGAASHQNLLKISISIEDKPAGQTYFGRHWSVWLDLCRELQKGRGWTAPPWKYPSTASPDTEVGRWLLTNWEIFKIHKTFKQSRQASIGTTKMSINNFQSDE